MVRRYNKPCLFHGCFNGVFRVLCRPRPPGGAAARVLTVPSLPAESCRPSCSLTPSGLQGQGPCLSHGLRKIILQVGASHRACHYG